MHKPTISQLEKYESIVRHERFDYGVFMDVDVLTQDRPPCAASRVHLDTLSNVLYQLESNGVYTPRTICNGRDVFLLFATLGQKEHDTITYNIVKQALQRLRVHISDGAYFLYIDTRIVSGRCSYRDVAIYASYERINGLETRAAVAGIEKPHAYISSELRARLEAQR